MVLLDTCALIWLASDKEALSEPARRAIASASGYLFVSAISMFELGVKTAKGRLTLPLPAERYYATALRMHGLTEIPIDGAIAARSMQLPPLHADPCDRFIVATAQLRELSLVTPDTHIRAYPETITVW